jgi:hypothetical protein
MRYCLSRSSLATQRLTMRAIDKKRVRCCASYLVQISQDRVLAILSSSSPPVMSRRVYAIRLVMGGAWPDSVQFTLIVPTSTSAPAIGTVNSTSPNTIAGSRASRVLGNASSRMVLVRGGWQRSVHYLTDDAFYKKTEVYVCCRTQRPRVMVLEASITSLLQCSQGAIGSPGNIRRTRFVQLS